MRSLTVRQLVDVVTDEGGGALRYTLPTMYVKLVGAVVPAERQQGAPDHGILYDEFLLQDTTGTVVCRKMALLSGSSDDAHAHPSDDAHAHPITTATASNHNYMRVVVRLHAGGQPSSLTTPPVVTAVGCSPVTDTNEITCHLLECIHQHIVLDSKTIKKKV